MFFGRMPIGRPWDRRVSYMEGSEGEDETGEEYDVAEIIVKISTIYENLRAIFFFLF